MIGCYFSLRAMGARYSCNGFELDVTSFSLDLVATSQWCDLRKYDVPCGSMWTFSAIDCFL